MLYPALMLPSKEFPITWKWIVNEVWSGEKNHLDKSTIKTMITEKMFFKENWSELQKLLSANKYLLKQINLFDNIRKKSDKIENN